MPSFWGKSNNKPIADQFDDSAGSRAPARKQEIGWSPENSETEQDPKKLEISWSSESSNSSTSSNGETRKHTVEITNLPLRTTKQDLLTRIEVAGPFGKVYSLHMVTEKGDKTATALLAFFSQECCHHFEAHVTDFGICVGDVPMRVQQTKRNLVPETVEPESEDDSRVLILEVQLSMYSETQMRKFLSTKLDTPESEIHYVKKWGASKTTGRIVVAFTTFAAARRVYKSLVNQPMFRVKWGRDPVESGVTTSWDYEKSLPGLFRSKINYPNWEIPKQK